jgi:hypothetical protein
VEDSFEDSMVHKGMHCQEEEEEEKKKKKKKKKCMRVFSQSLARATKHTRTGLFKNSFLLGGI